jgi:hypothetical protein
MFRFKFTFTTQTSQLKHRITIFFATLILSITGDSQTIYELEYTFGEGAAKMENRAFLVRNDDGTGFIRSVYVDPTNKELHIVEMLMEEHYGADENGQEDTTQLVFEGKDPHLILGSNAYPPDIFVFKLNDETGYYEPFAVLSPNDDGSHVEGEFNNARLLEDNDLTEDFVLEFFTKEDEFYINRFATEVRTLTDAQKKTRLFLILVANTEDITIGKTCLVDKDATYKVFSQVAEFLEIQFVPTVIDGKTFSKANVEKAINGIRPSPSDIVVFYYSGHGFNYDKEGYRFPYLDLRDKSFQIFGGQYTLNIESIYQKIKAKGARMNLVLSDCCNNDPSQAANISTDAASTRTSSIGWDMDNCRNLFMNPQRISILMTAAQKGELSAGNSNDGGIFTFNFRQSLEKYLKPFTNTVTWKELADAAKKQTIVKANHTWCRMPDNTRKVCVQNPVFKIE